MLFAVSLLSRPAIMNAWPEPSSTVVSAVRLLSAGTLESTEKSRLDTVGRTRSEMRPSACTVGVKASCTPYCLNSLQIGRGECRERVWQFGEISLGAV